MGEISAVIDGAPDVKGILKYRKVNLAPLFIGGEQIAQRNLPPHQTAPQHFQEKRRMPDLLKGSAVRWNETNSSRS
jgi:hypothetical protein